MTEQGIAEWVRQEQRHLWSDLDEAIRYSVNGAWSMRASNVAIRIIGSARLVGPAAHGEIPWRLVAGGVYEALLRIGGVEVEMPDAAEWSRLDTMMTKHGGTATALRVDLAGTVASIENDAAWLSSAEHYSEDTET